jgi:hypothetical protein
LDGAASVFGPLDLRELSDSVFCRRTWDEVTNTTPNQGVSIDVDQTIKPPVTELEELPSKQAFEELADRIIADHFTGTDLSFQSFRLSAVSCR